VQLPASNMLIMQGKEHKAMQKTFLALTNMQEAGCKCHFFIIEMSNNSERSLILKN
jgi:hypothetical protein